MATHPDYVLSGLRARSTSNAGEGRGLCGDLMEALRLSKEEFMHSLLQDFRKILHLRREFLGSSITVTLIIFLTLAIDAAMLANFCKAVVHHFSCRDLPLVVKVEMEAAMRCMCGLYSQITVEDVSAVTSMRPLNICQSKS
jgi:hypothetical protein